MQFGRAGFGLLVIGRFGVGSLGLSIETFTEFLKFDTEGECFLALLGCHSSEIFVCILAGTDEFRGQLCGGMWTDEVYDKYISQLNAADVDSYLKAYEDQLNAWLEATGN